VLRDARDPQTWVCKLWWPAEWHTHVYAADFDLLREFGLLLLTQTGPWEVVLEAADPVAQFILVWYGRQKVAEVYVDRDGATPRILVSYSGAEEAFETPAE